MNKKERTYLKIFDLPELPLQEDEEAIIHASDEQARAEYEVMLLEAKALKILRRMANSRCWRLYYKIRKIFETPYLAICKKVKSIFYE